MHEGQNPGDIYDSFLESMVNEVLSFYPICLALIIGKIVSFHVLCNLSKNESTGRKLMNFYFFCLFEALDDFWSVILLCEFRKEADISIIILFLLDYEHSLISVASPGSDFSFAVYN